MAYLLWEYAEGMVLKMEMRECKKCNKKYPLTDEYFSRKNNGKFLTWCIHCREIKKRKNDKYDQTEKGKECIARAREKARQQMAQERLINPKDTQFNKTKENGYNRCYVCRNHYLFTEDNFMTKDGRLIGRCKNCTDDSEAYLKQLEKRRIYLKEHPEIREKKNQYRRDHPEKRNAQKAKYAATENGHRKIRDKERRKNQKRRAMKRGLESSLTGQQWEDSKSFFNGCCAYCGCEGEMTQDHFIPVINGGEYSRDNILPVCRSCNSHKQAQDFFVWYPAQPFYSKMREKRLIKYLNYKGEGLQQRTLFG